MKKFKNAAKKAIKGAAGIACAVLPVAGGVAVGMTIYGMVGNPIVGGVLGIWFACVSAKALSYWLVSAYQMAYGSPREQLTRCDAYLIA